MKMLKDEMKFPADLELGFSRAIGNKALVEAGICNPSPYRKTGTTIVAAVYKVGHLSFISFMRTNVESILQDGIVMGGDSRATSGNIIEDKFCLKVHELSESIYACGAGTAADLDAVSWIYFSDRFGYFISRRF